MKIRKLTPGTPKLAFNDKVEKKVTLLLTVQVGSYRTLDSKFVRFVMR